MKHVTPRVLFVLLLLLALPACGGEPDASGAGDAHAIVFQKGEVPFGGFAFNSGQPDEARLRALAPEVARVVNLRAPDEDWKGKPKFDEAAAVAAVGGSYVSVPVTKKTVRDPAVRKQVYALFEEAMKEPAKLTWFHCSSGNRVGGLWALYRAEVEGKPLEEAIADGKAAGMTRLEPIVREILAP